MVLQIERGSSLPTPICIIAIILSTKANQVCETSGRFRSIAVSYQFVWSPFSCTIRTRHRPVFQETWSWKRGAHRSFKQVSCVQNGRTADSMGVLITSHRDNRLYLSKPRKSHQTSHYVFAAPTGCSAQDTQKIYTLKLGYSTAYILGKIRAERCDTVTKSYLSWWFPGFELLVLLLVEVGLFMFVWH